MKRILALLLGIVLLMAAVPAVPALADGEMDQLKEIATKVETEYLQPMSEGKDARPEVLETCLEILENAQGGPKKKPLELYCQVLLAIERGDFDDANYTMFVLSQGSMKKTFDKEFIEKSGGETETSLLTIEELALYLQGREAEQNNERDAALAAYDKCNNRADAYYRIQKIEEEQYSDALELKRQGKYDSAKEILKKLAERQYPWALEDLKDWSTPTPKPTETPKPTIVLQSNTVEDRVQLTWKCSQSGVICELQRQVGKSNTWETIKTEPSGKSNSIQDENLTRGENYRYRVVAEELDIVSNEITVKIQPTATPKPTATPTPKPTATPTPKISTELWTDEVTTDHVSLMWQCSQYGAAFQLQRQEGKSSIWEVVVDDCVYGTYYHTDWSITAGQSYRYRVVVSGQKSNELTVNVPKPTATPKPTTTPTPKITISLWKDDVTTDHVSLGWQCSEYGARFQLQRQDDRSSTWFTVDEGYADGTNYFTDWAVAWGQSYRYRVVVSGQNSNELSVNVPKPTATPKPTQKVTPKPTATQKPSVSISLQLNRAGINSVDLSWTCGRSGVTYEVQRKGGGSNSWSTLTTTSSKSYTDNSAKAGTKYTYRIVAQSATGTSNEVSVTTLQNSTPTPKPKTWGSWSSWSTNPVSASSTRQVETKVETEYYSVTVYHYNRWKYYNTGYNMWYYSYAQYTGENYKAGTGEWQYKTTYEPLATNGESGGHTRYADWWWNQTTTTEQKSRQVTYYRYRDYK